ncbi:MAG: GNAT family N-acetyltransferase [Cyanobacteria bacterium P01_A01_bin.40]
MIIREATEQDISAISKVHVDTSRTTYRGIFSDEYLDNMSYQKRERAWHQVFEETLKNNNFTYVAENNSHQIIGFANAGLEREGDSLYLGELYAIYILENFQQQGIGEKLVRTVVEQFKKMQINSMLVWVLKDNSACSFYKKLGGIKIKEQEIERQGNKLIKIAYGWRDIAVRNCIRIS